MLKTIIRGTCLLAVVSSLSSCADYYDINPPVTVTTTNAPPASTSMHYGPPSPPPASASMHYGPSRSNPPVTITNDGADSMHYGT